DVNLRRALPLDFYHAALDRLHADFGAENLEVRIYSDGVGWPVIGPLRGKELIRHLASRVLGWGGIRPQFAPRVNAFTWQVQRNLPTLRRELAAFARAYPGSVLRAGRSAALTRETIHAFASADIIVVARAHAFPDLGLGLNANQLRITPTTIT